uniref:Regulator of G-protein signaling 17-like isoform X2 n=1 Tax=Petromyzon marinus TaxID=7757 RepID=A0AAJ7T408_PETMA|nr:regulator of G-protein signaling 17-like isoform X2 [Petromyzon marinus]
MPRPVKGPSQPGGDSAEAEESGAAEGAGTDRDACCFCWCCCCSCSCLAPQGEDSPTSSRKNSHTTRTEDCTDSEAASGRAGADEVLAWGRSFERLVRSPTGRAHFRHFLRGEFSEDNLLFWLACEELRAGTDDTSLPERMRTIYEEYISILSPREGLAPRKPEATPSRDLTVHSQGQQSYGGSRRGRMGLHDWCTPARVVKLYSGI